MPSEIISFLHKIQIIGEWHDLWKLKHLMADVKAQGEACFSGWFIPPDGWLAGWPCFLMTVAILAPINLATQWIFWQASLFSAIISPIMDCVVRSPAPSTRYLELESIWRWGREYYVWFKDEDNTVGVCCWILNVNLSVGILTACISYFISFELMFLSSHFRLWVLLK